MTPTSAVSLRLMLRGYHTAIFSGSSSAVERPPCSPQAMSMAKTGILIGVIGLILYLAVAPVLWSVMGIT